MFFVLTLMHFSEVSPLKLLGEVLRPCIFLERNENAKVGSLVHVCLHIISSIINVEEKSKWRKKSVFSLHWFTRNRNKGNPI